MSCILQKYKSINIFLEGTYYPPSLIALALSIGVLATIPASVYEFASIAGLILLKGVPAAEAILPTILSIVGRSFKSTPYADRFGADISSSSARTSALIQSQNALTGGRASASGGRSR